MLFTQDPILACPPMFITQSRGPVTLGSRPGKPYPELPHAEKPCMMLPLAGQDFAETLKYRRCVALPGRFRGIFPSSSPE